MSAGEEAVSLLCKWLKTENGYNYVRTFVRYKISGSWKAGHLARIAAALHLDPIESPNEYLEEITHDFLLFTLLFADTKLAGRPALTAQLYSGRYRYFLDTLWTRYVWNIKDKNRIKTDNPRGYLYRRFREIVSSEADFATCCNGTGHLFYRLGSEQAGTATEAEAVNILSAETYGDYPQLSNPLQPDKNGDFRLTAEWLADTARFFYSLAAEKYPRQHYFAVSELVRYLATVMPWLNRPTRQSNAIDCDAASDQPNQLERIAATAEDDDVRLDRLRQIRTIRPLAGQLVACWDRVECCIFAWRLQDIPLTLETIAEKLSLRSHNQVHGLFEKTKNSLKRFCTDWPGPPLHELAPGVAEFFVNKVRQEAKKKCDGP